MPPKKATSAAGGAGARGTSAGGEGNPPLPIAEFKGAYEAGVWAGIAGGGNITRTLPEKTLGIIAEYSLNGYQHWNQTLRNNAGDLSEAFNYDPAKGKVRTLQATLLAHAITAPAVVYRASTISGIPDDWAIGTTRTDHGFSSTSVDRMVIKGFGDTGFTSAGQEAGRTVRAMIELPVGTRGLYIAPASALAKEQEFLLPFSTTYQLLGRGVDAAGIPTVRLRVVAQPTP